jgi:hypothetical protein
MAFKFDPVKFSDVCAYAIMSNHLVLKINSTSEWDGKLVLAFWSQLCKLPLICDKFMKSEPQGKTELEMVYQQTDIYRKRLMSISWFIRIVLILTLLHEGLRENSFHTNFYENVE